MDLAEIPQMESVRLLLLERARSGYESLRTTRRRPRTIPSCAGSLPGHMAAWATSTRCWVILKKPSLPIDQAIALLKELRAESPDSVPYVRDLVRCHLGLGILFKELYRLQDARAELLAAVELKGPLEATGKTDDRQASGRDRLSAWGRAGERAAAG